MVAAAVPGGFGGGDAKDFLTWLAPYAALVVLALAAFRIRRTAGLLVLGVGAAIYYASRADLEHAQGLLVITAALAALIRPKVFGAAVLALLIVVGTANRASALLRPPDLKPFGSVRVPPAEAEALPQVIALVHELVPPGEPIYVAPRRSDLVTLQQPAPALPDGSPERPAPRRPAAGQARRAGADRRRARASQAEGDHPLDRAGVREARAQPPRPPERLPRPRRLPRRCLRAARTFGDYEVLVPRY